MYIDNKPSCEVDMLLKMLKTTPAPELFGLRLRGTTVAKMRIIEDMSDGKFKEYVEYLQAKNAKA